MILLIIFRYNENKGNVNDKLMLKKKDENNFQKLFVVS